MQFQPTRRRLLAASAFAAAGFMVDDAFAEPLAPTPQCHDGDAPTVRQGEGPFFKPSSPERADLVEPNSKARLVELRGQVLTRSCRPVPQTLIDLWNADDRGEYDTGGFRYRGHLFTDAEGAIASAPFCRRSTLAARVITTLRCKRRSSACSPRSSIFRTSRRTGGTACFAASW